MKALARISLTLLNLSFLILGFEIAFIPRTVKLSEAPSFGMPVVYYDRYGKGSRAYMKLAKEILKNDKKRGEVK